MHNAPRFAGADGLPQHQPGEKTDFEPAQRGLVRKAAVRVPHELALAFRQYLALHAPEAPPEMRCVSTSTHTSKAALVLKHQRIDPLTQSAELCKG